MPKLNKTKAKQVHDAEMKEGFTPLEEGQYVLRLREVDGTGDGPKGPYWTWIYEIPEGYEHEGRRVFNTTSLSDEAMGMPGGLKQTFEAFGVPADTDTDELCGELIEAYIVQRTIQKGDRKGQLGNNVENFFPYDPDGDASAEAAGDAEPM